jgi:hypothetical protein
MGLESMYYGGYQVQQGETHLDGSTRNLREFDHYVKNMFYIYVNSLSEICKDVGCIDPGGS